MYVTCEIECRDTKGRKVALYNSKAENHELRLVVKGCVDNNFSVWNEDIEWNWQTVKEGVWTKRKDILKTNGLTVNFMNQSWVYFKENGGRLYMTDSVIKI